MYLFELLIVIIETAIMVFYCGNIFGKRRRQVTNIKEAVLILLLMAAVTFTGSLRLGVVVNLTISYIECLILCLLIYEGTVKIKLFVSAIFVVAVIFADYLATIIITFFGIEYNMSGGDNITYITGAMLTCFIKLWLLTYAGKVLSGKIRDLPFAYWIFLFICPVLSIVCLIIFNIYLMQATTINAMLVLIPPLCILYINFMSFRFFESFSEQLRLKVIEKMSESEQENYEILQDNETELRKLRHDMKNHIMMMHEYIANNDAQTALQHLGDIQTTLDKLSVTVCTSNPAIDAAINIGARKAQTANIDYTVQIIGDATIDIEAADICRFLSNAIDNAVEGCKDCANPYVYIELNILEEKINIHIENSILRRDKSKPFEFITTKADKEYHGYGIKNMKSVVKKYSGIMESEAADDIFYLDAVLYSSKNVRK